jgi:hypothetical protein
MPASVLCQSVLGQRDLGQSVLGQRDLLTPS